jgi:WD40 repeat protein
MSEEFASVNTKISVPEVMNRSAMARQPTRTLAKQNAESNGAEFMAPEFDDAKTIGAQSKVAEITETTELGTHRSRSIGSITTVGKLRLGGGRDGVDHAASYIAFSPDGKTLVTAERDSMILYTIGYPTEKIRFETMRWPREGKDVHEIVFSPDGKFLASGSENRVSGLQHIYLWQITHLIQRRPLAGSRSILREHKRPVFLPRWHTSGQRRLCWQNSCLETLMILDLRCIKGIARSYLGSRSSQMGIC